MNLDADFAMIDQVEKILFKQHFSKAADRKKAARFVFSLCPDDKLWHLLGNAVGYCAKNPDHSKNYIYKARGHIETLRAARLPPLHKG
jgi:hypothetical protein